MDNLINLAEYRQAPMEPMAVPLEDALGPFTRIHTDLSGYDDDAT